MKGRLKLNTCVHRHLLRLKFSCIITTIILGNTILSVFKNNKITQLCNVPTE